MGPDRPHEEPADVEQPAQEAPPASGPEGDGDSDNDVVREAPPRRDRDPREIE